MVGRLIKSVSDFYYVDTGERVYTCKAKGIFKKNKMTPLVGDLCEIEATNTSDIEANIVSISPRTSELTRPNVSNVDQVLLVFALKDPDPITYLLDKLLVNFEARDLPIVIAFTKWDLDEKGIGESLLALYQGSGYRCLPISSRDGVGIEELKSFLEGKISVVCGPSGAGKSTLINTLSGKEIMETGSVSKKTRRGKQTTRHTQLIPLWRDSFIADTPGFSFVDVLGVDKKDLYKMFPEFSPFGEDCRFSGCSHISEPDCGIKAALEEGKITPERYDSYTKLYKELSEPKY